MRKQRKRIYQTISAGLLAALVLAPAPFLPLFAEDYSDEQAWIIRCTQIQDSQEGVKACEGFQEYQKGRKQELMNQINDFNQSIDQIQNDVNSIEELAARQRELSASLQRDIDEQQQAIETIDENISLADAEIERLDGEIERKEAAIEDRQREVDIWDDQIKERMKAEQVQSGTNVYIDLVMGSTSLPDMFRRISGLEQITRSDQDQVAEVNKRKEELENDRDLLQQQKEQQEFHKEELNRLRQDRQDNIDGLNERQEHARAMEESYQKLIEEYQKVQADLEAKMRSVKQDMEAIREFVISTGLTENLDYNLIPKSNGWLAPVGSYIRSAGTWAYNGGGLHLGLDMAAPIGSELKAPISGIVIYTSNTQPTNGGYLGNYSGAPAGSGNCIEMLGEVDGTLYAISFFHLSNEFYVQPGSLVKQGQVMALTGNAGNSTGAHTHMEVYNLGGMSMQEAIAYFQSSGDWAFKTGWGTTSTACEYTESTPCRERPEKFIY